jgi:hypothetical protein
LLPAEYWERSWSGRRLPMTVRAQAIPDEHRLFRRFLPAAGQDTTLAEIGCAPGKWLHYFRTEFGYSVTGIDSAPATFRFDSANSANSTNRPGWKLGLRTTWADAF